MNEHQKPKRPINNHRQSCHVAYLLHSRQEAINITTLAGILQTLFFSEKTPSTCTFVMKPFIIIQKFINFSKNCIIVIYHHYSCDSWQQKQLKDPPHVIYLVVKFLFRSVAQLLLLSCLCSSH